ncbi:hypothetical protein, partial [Accumulibacter sp.]|uniref:hypothetical protein n=1 Tax=Accumulibacter sp. TaxID=2053492 RepID=UPI0028C45634
VTCFLKRALRRPFFLLPRRPPPPPCAQRQAALIRLRLAAAARAWVRRPRPMGRDRSAKKPWAAIDAFDPTARTPNCGANTTRRCRRTGITLVTLAAVKALCQTSGRWLKSFAAQPISIAQQISVL